MPRMAPSSVSVWSTARDAGISPCRAAIPKSSSFAPAFVSMMFAGFRSRWTTALPVRVGECTGNLDGEAQDLIERQRTSAQALRERFSLEMLHHDELNAALLADVVERADVRMADLGDGQRLALETLDALVSCDFW